jgi:hypothetical protein
MNSVNDSVAFLRAAQQEAWPSHVYALFDTPGEFRIPCGAQGSEQRYGSRRGTPGRRILERCIERRTAGGLEFSRHDDRGADVGMTGERHFGSRRENAHVCRVAGLGGRQRRCTG